MSALLMGRAFYVPLDQSSKLVLLALADHATDEGLGARPGLHRLQVKTGLSRASVQRALVHLEAHGLIVSRGYRRGGKGRATIWIVESAQLRLWADLYEDDRDEYQTVSERDCSMRKQCHLAGQTVSSGGSNSRTIARPQPSGTIRNQAESDFQRPEGGIVAEFKRRVNIDT